MISGLNCWLNSGYRELCADGSCERGGGNEGEGTVLVPWHSASTMYWIPTNTLHFVPTKILRCSLCPFYTRKLRLMTRDTPKHSRLIYSWGYIWTAPRPTSETGCHSTLSKFKSISSFQQSTRSCVASSSLELLHSLELLFFSGSFLNVHYALYSLLFPFSASLESQANVPSHIFTVNYFAC